jgi:hypothetical protein
VRRALVVIFAPLWVPLLAIYVGCAAAREILVEIWRERREIGR